MLLNEYCLRYQYSHDICESYANDLQVTCRQLCEFAARSLSLDDLSDDLLNRFLFSLKDRAAPRTIKNKRTNLCVLWRAASEEGLVPGVPLRIRSIKVPEQIPEAFLASELVALLQAAGRLKGYFPSNGISRRLWWVSLFDGYYDTAIRLGDLLSIERQWIWNEGVLSIVQHKTGHAHHVQLRPKTMAEIDELCGGRKTGPIWPLWGRREQFFWAFRKLRKAAGLERGTSKWIRRSSASYVALHYGEAAAERHLGHRTSGLARKSYLDPRICVAARVLPPPLPDVG